MKKHLYQIDIAPVKDKDGIDCSHLKHIKFDFACHDDLFQILDKVGQIDGITEQEKNNFIIGIKLLGEVMLEHRKHPLFEELAKPFDQFMRRLKSQAKPTKKRV
ncbi:DUF3861 domain-containing protein [Vibrio sp. HA2012]|uniref:DUF3861 domain-containing protein n=1 Tax=Vibrio sp. HA2012 TaxID=1971595 RepID=UPI0012FE1BE1|nr:DUF3861 domain-containing protein [Vibrio sp. HA2012]